jgi:anti-sigma B factor antagonist
MQLKIEKIDNVTQVTILENKFTNIIASGFSDKLKSVIDEGNYCILINLEQVNYMDSSGFGSIIIVLNYLNEIKEKTGENTSLGVCNLSKNVDFLFSMVKATNVMGIYQDTDSALASLK